MGWLATSFSPSPPELDEDPATPAGAVSIEMTSTPTDFSSLNPEEYKTANDWKSACSLSPNNVKDPNINIPAN